MSPETPVGDTLRLLFAEDSRDDVELCTATLRKAGVPFVFDWAPTLERFEHFARTNTYDAVLTDFELVDWNGFDAINALQRLNIDVPVILVTGYLGDEKAVECIQNGAADYVLKDRMSRLPIAIRRAVAVGAAQREQARLTEQLHLLAAGIRSVDEGLFIVDDRPNLAEAAVVLANEALARHVGLSLDELRGRPLRFFAEVHTPDSFFEGLRASLRQHNTFRSEVCRQRQDGNLAYFEWQIHPIVTPEGAWTHHVCVYRDITVRKRSEEELRIKNEELSEQTRQAREANRQKTEFLANMSHEVRTPLNCIIGFVELLYDGKLGPLTSDQREYLASVLDNSRHLLDLLNRVLDLSKVEAGSMEFSPEPIDLDALLPEIADNFQSFALRAGVRLEVEVEPQVRSVVTDLARLKQVLYNYVSNAIKFSPDGGPVCVRVLPEGDRFFRIEVQDSGIGIRDEDIPKLFIEFQQLDSTTAKRFAGTGLGLALTRRIAESQGGFVGVKSVPQKGSTFYAVLPISPESTAGHQSSSPALPMEVIDG